MSNILWSTPHHLTGKIIRCVAAYGNVPLELPEQYEHFVDNKKPEYLKKFPHGRIPALEQPDGFYLFEYTAIARYIASLAPNSGLLGDGDIRTAALVDQWLHLVESEVETNGTLIFQLINGFVSPYNKSLHTLAIERATRALKTLETHLSTRTFLVGERITIADIYLAGAVKRSVEYWLDAPARKEFPHIIRHLETLVHQPKFVDIFGETEYTEKARQFVPPAKEKKEPKPAQPAAAPKPKAEKKKAKDEDEDEDDGALVPPEPKARNPLDDLPKSSFNLEDWKRFYSNNDTRGSGGAIEWFYNHFDKEGFSVWRFDFKYNEELTLVFMSSNQVSGFFNRLEASRKYLFSSAGVLGENNNSVISGVLICRGHDIVPVVDAAPDYESYTYKRLDYENDEKDKAFFEAALAWDLEVDGKVWAAGKLFK